MLSLVPLLSALCGQYINYTPEWSMVPEKTLQPRMPTPFDSWNLATTPKFAFASTDWASDGSIVYQDTVELAWQSAGGIFEEIHRGTKENFSRFAKTRVVAYGVDTMRAKKGQAAADSLRKWNRPSSLEAWRPEEVVHCRDTVGGRSCTDSTYWIYGDTLRKELRWIKEKVDPNGYLVRRDTIASDSGRLLVLYADSLVLGQGGKPLKYLRWDFKWADDSLALSGQVEFSWNGNQLIRAKETSPFLTYERALHWGPGGRLDSSLFDAIQDGYRFSYDAQGLMTGWTYQELQTSYARDALGRVVVVRTNMESSRTKGAMQEFQLDSAILDGQGRLAVMYNCINTSLDTLLDRSRCTRRTYAYDISVALETPARTRAAGQVRREGSRLVAQGISDRPLTLKILRPDGRLERTEKAMGEIGLEIRDLPKGLLLWSLASEGSAQASGRIWLPSR